MHRLDEYPETLQMIDLSIMELGQDDARLVLQREINKRQGRLQRARVALAFLADSAETKALIMETDVLAWVRCHPCNECLLPQGQTMTFHTPEGRRTGEVYKCFGCGDVEVYGAVVTFEWEGERRLGVSWSADRLLNVRGWCIMTGPDDAWDFDDEGHFVADASTLPKIASHSKDERPPF